MPTLTPNNDERVRGSPGERGIVHGPEPPSTAPRGALEVTASSRAGGLLHWLREIFRSKQKVRFTILEDARRPKTRYTDGEPQTGTDHESPRDDHSQREGLTREGGVQILRNSNGAIIGHLEVTNVAGNVVNYYGIGAEDLRTILAGAQAITPTPRNVGNSSANSFILTDALGEEITLGFSSVQTFEGLKKFLVFHFDGKLGERLVRDGRYCIMTARDGREVSPKNWEEVYEAREPMTMAVLIWKTYQSKKALECPKCGKTKLGVMQNGGQRLCRKCNTGFFRPLTAKRDKLEPDVVDDHDMQNFRHIRRAGMTIEQRVIRREIDDREMEIVRDIDDDDDMMMIERRMEIAAMMRNHMEKTRQLAITYAAMQQGHSDASRFQELGD